MVEIDNQPLFPMKGVRTLTRERVEVDEVFAFIHQKT